jgi:xylulokinase
MILAIDVGTSILKAALFEKDGTLVSRAESPLTLIAHPDPLWHESDATEWIRGVRGIAVRLGLARVPRIDAVVVSGNGPTLVPADAEGNPLAKAMSWMDRRGVAEATIISERSGRPIDPTFHLPKAFWFFRNRPALYERTRYFFSCPEFVSFVLTGEPVTFLPAPDFTRYIWEENLIRGLGMEPDRFPRFLESGKRVGSVTASGEAATGIPAGTPVVAGAPDFVVSLLGTATVAPGRACVRSGTSEGINLCSRTPIEDRRLMCLGHIVRGCWNVSGIISTSGKALEWYKNASGRSADSYESVFADVGSVAAGANRLLFLPYLAGERAPLWDPLARGAFIGLTLNHGVPHMMRAVAESVAYAIRDVVDVMEEIGLTVQDMRITGSPSRSPVWNQLKADVTGRRILVPLMPDSDLAGDACLALCSLGEFGSVAEAAEAVVKMGAAFDPDVRKKALYDDMFHLYRDCYRGLKPVFEKLSTSRSET